MSSQRNRTVMGRMRNLSSRMQQFEDEHSRLISGLVLFEPAAQGASRGRTQTYGAATLPVSNLRSAMSEVAERMDSQHQTLQDMVNDTRRFRENATIVLDQPRHDLAPQRQEIAVSMAGEPDRGSLKARKARNALGTPSLPTHVLKTAPVGEDGEAVTCAICLDVLRVNHEVASLPCVHSFHASCILQWADKKGGLHVSSCPLCKHPILQQSAASRPPPSSSSSSHPLSQPSRILGVVARGTSGLGAHTESPPVADRALSSFGFASWQADFDRAGQRAERGEGRLWGAGGLRPPPRPTDFRAQGGAREQRGERGPGQGGREAESEGRADGLGREGRDDEPTQGSQREPVTARNCDESSDLPLVDRPTSPAQARVRLAEGLGGGAEVRAASRSRPAQAQTRPLSAQAGPRWAGEAVLQDGGLQSQSGLGVPVSGRVAESRTRPGTAPRALARVTAGTGGAEAARGTPARGSDGVRSDSGVGWEGGRWRGAKARGM